MRNYSSTATFLCAVVSLALLGGCQTLQDMIGTKPTARVVGTSLRGLTLENVVLVFDVEISNPYAASLPLLDIGYMLASKGNKVLEGSIQPSGAIPARGSQVIQLPATIRFTSLAAALRGMKPGSVVPYTAEFNIGVDAPVLGRINVPLSRSGELPVPAVPQVELVSFNVAKLSLDQTRATAKLRVKNTNQFALDLNKLGLRLALGGNEIGKATLANSASLAPGQNATIDVPLSFSPRAVGLGLLSLLKGSESGYSLSGSIEAGTAFGPIELPFTRSGNTRILR